MSTFMNLKPGRTIKLKPGFGIPSDTQEEEEVVAYAGKRYAITASGVLLQETDREGIEVTGFKQGTFHISAKARRLQEALLLPLEQPYLAPHER